MLCIHRKSQLASSFWVSVWSVFRAVKSRQLVTPELCRGIACTFPMPQCSITVNQVHAEAGKLLRVHLALNRVTITPVSRARNTSVCQSVCCAAQTPTAPALWKSLHPLATFPEFLFEYPYAQSPHGTDKKKKKIHNSRSHQCQLHSASRLSP